MAEVIETRRLVLSAWDEENAALLARLATDLRVVRYIGDGHPWSPEKVGQVSGAMAEHWRLHGFGWRAATEKDSAELVGFAALNLLGEGTARLDPGEYEVGWWLVPAAWGRGLASEAASAMCQEAFERVGAPSLIARVQPGNRASAAVATRLGMSHVLDTTGRVGEALAVYRLLAADWSQSQAARAVREAYPVRPVSGTTS